MVRARAPRQPRFPGIVLGGILLVLLLLVAPSEGVTQSTTTFGAPYSGTTSNVSMTHDPHGSRACASSVPLSSPTWYPRTGRMGWGGSISARTSGSCINPVYCGLNSSCLLITLAVTVPIPSPSSSGYHQVSANWSYRGQFTWNSSHGPCPSANLSSGSGFQDCTLLLNAFTGVSLGIEDLTMGSPVYSTSTIGGPRGISTFFEYHRDETCTNHACTNQTSVLGSPQGVRSVSARGVFYANGTWLNATHRYALELRSLPWVFAIAYFSGLPWRSSAAARLDFATGHNGFLLRQVTEH